MIHNNISRFDQERRHHPRTHLQMTLRGIRLDPDGDMVDSFYMTDISRNGMGAIVDRPYYRGQRVVLSLPSVSTGSRRNVSATVIRCRVDAEGYRVGLEFDQTDAGLCAHSMMPAQVSNAAAA